MELFDKYSAVLERTDPIKHVGVVRKVTGILIESTGPSAVLGELCQIQSTGKGGPVWAEVVGFQDSTVQLMPYDVVDNLEPGCMVTAMGSPLEIAVSDQLQGRVLGSMGQPIDGRGLVGAREWYPVQNTPPDVLRRKKIEKRIITGVRSIDALCAVGKGQRLGIFSGSGVGKSTILGMIARHTSADVNVIALIGERGREVREFIENELGKEGLERSVVIVSSSNTPPLARVRGAYVATAIAEYFRDQGNDVMLLFDSVTRFARAQREIGLAVGEPPANRGFTPSVFSSLPRLLERCGTSEKGTITGFYSILVEGDDMDEPISDNVRGILDGHIVLSRKLAQSYHYPAVDVLSSLSRLARVVSSPEDQRAAGLLRRLLAAYYDAEDLINVGAYVEGSNPLIDEAIEKIGDIRAFLCQEIDEKAPLEDTLRRARELAGLTEEA